MKPKVSPISVSKGAGVPRATGPHSLLTAGLVAVGAASLPLAILSLTTLPSRACDGLGQTRAICIQLERGALRVSVRASPLEQETLTHVWSL